MAKKTKLVKIASSDALVRLPAGTKLLDASGDEYLMTNRGCIMFPDDPDRKVLWSSAEFSRLMMQYGPFNRVITTGKEKKNVEETKATE